MKSKVIIIFSCIIIFCTLVCGVLFYLNFVKEKNFEEVYTVSIENRNDLTELLGCDFKNANINSVLTDSSDRCVCVILDEDYTDFSKDYFIQSAFFSPSSGVFKSLKETFPNKFDMEFSDLNNNHSSAKDYCFQLEDSLVVSPYYINWFTAEIDNKERIVIYAFLPDEIQSIKNIFGGE